MATARGATGNSKSLRVRVTEATDRLRALTLPAALRARWDRISRRLGITRSGRAAIAGAIVLWLMGRVVAGTAMYLAAYGVVMLLVVSSLLAPRRLKVTGKRTGLFDRVQQGTTLDVEVSLTAERSVSTFMLEEHTPEVLGHSVKVPVLKLAGGASVSHRYGLRAARRGVYEIGPLVAITRDPLGLIERESVVAEPFELLVHPRVDLVSDRPLTRNYEDPPIRPPVSKPWPSGLEFYGMRDYQPGDDLRRIVWRASARTGKLMVREAEQGITDRITIVLDTDATHHSPHGAAGSESFEMGVRVAASLGVKHLVEGYEVRCETNAGPLTRPMRGQAQQLILLDGLARVELQRAPLSTTLQRLLLGTAQRDAHNVLITPHLSIESAKHLRLLLSTGVSVLVVVLEWDEDDESLTRAALLGCQVVSIGPNTDLAGALARDVGAGSR